MSTDIESAFKLVPDLCCASCQIEDVPMAEFPRRSYKPGVDDPQWASVLLCELCAGTQISLRTVHYPRGETDVFTVMAQLTHILLREARELKSDIASLKAEVALLREDIQGPELDDEDEPPRPEMKVCVYCKRAIHSDGRAWLTNDGGDMCEVNPEFGRGHEPEPDDKDDEA